MAKLTAKYKKNRHLKCLNTLTIVQHFCFNITGSLLTSLYSFNFTSSIATSLF